MALTVLPLATVSYLEKATPPMSSREGWRSKEVHGPSKRYGEGTCSGDGDRGEMERDCLELEYRPLFRTLHLKNAARKRKRGPEAPPLPDLGSITFGTLLCSCSESKEICPHLSKAYRPEIALRI